METYRTERSVYTPTDFLNWREKQSLVITPKFQRRGVWKTPAKSYFIDTLLRGMPVPPIYLRLVQKEDKTGIAREVVDGQQRIKAVLDYIDGKYRLSTTLKAPWAGSAYARLTPSDRGKIESFSFSTEIFKGISDEEVLNVFSRLNLHSVKLNAQELRNGKYFGHFKQLAYQLALDHLTFWRKHKIFSEVSIARMLEVELTSELLIAGHAGMQDKKTSVDKFYHELNDAYTGKAADEKRFRQTMGEISEVFDGDLAESEFHRAPLFYTLYCTVYHYAFGIPKEQRRTPKKVLTIAKQISLRDAALHLSEIVSVAREEKGNVPKKYAEFVAACLSQTDNIKPRKIRFDTLFEEAF